VADLLDHFSPAKIVRVTDGPVDVFLHIDAAVRLRRVLTVMKNMQHPLPTIGEGFSLRGFYKGAFQHPRLHGACHGIRDGRHCWPYGDHYFDTLEAIKAEKAKGARADPKKLEKLKTERRGTLSLIPLLTSGWIKVIDDEIAKTIQSHPAIENLRSPADLRRGIAEANAAIVKGRAEAARTLAAKARAEQAGAAAAGSPAVPCGSGRRWSHSRTPSRSPSDRPVC
jgi:hypothetical protein